MPIDPSRRALIENEWRPAVQADAAIIALYPEARDVIIDSAIDTNAAATPFSSALFDILKVPRKRYQVTLKGSLEYKPSDWQGGPKTVTLKSSRYNIAAGLLGIVVAVRWDFQKDETTLEVWG